MGPTRVEWHALERCPECAYRLTGESIDYTREVVDLTLASVFATWVARHLNPFRECLAALQRPTAHAPP